VSAINVVSAIKQWNQVFLGYIASQSTDPDGERIVVLLPEIKKVA